jgi:hypothetical protein
MKKGDSVRIVKSNHSCIEPGRMGVIECAFEGGYGVRVTGHFFLPGVPSKMLNETRTVWFQKEWIATVDAQEQEEPAEFLSSRMDERLYGAPVCVGCDALVRVTE